MSKINSMKNGKIDKSNIFTVWLVICAIIFTCGTFINANDSYPHPKLEKMKLAVKEGREKVQEPIPGIVLLKTGKDKKITNMSLLLFLNDQNRGYMSIVGLRKTKISELCDTNNPKKMYAAIKKYTSYTVDKYIMYSNRTILELLKVEKGISLYLQVDKKSGINDVTAINKNASDYVKKYDLKKDEKLMSYGYQPLGFSQVLAYANLYYQDYYYQEDDYMSVVNDWRNIQVLYPLINIMRQQSMEDLEKSWKAIKKGKHSIRDKDLMNMCAALKNYSLHRLGKRSLINR